VSALAVVAMGMCFTWPALEALISTDETREGLQHMVGVYNVVWAGTGAAAYFSGGAIMDALGPQALFVVPIFMVAAQLALTFWLETQCGPTLLTGTPDVPQAATPSASHSPGTRLGGRSFLLMSWLANPFAYIAINTLVAVMPGIARRLELSTMLAGFCCSVWCFTRFGAFVLLWFWSGWHYRFRWLLAAFIALIASFVAVLIVPNLAVVVVAQVFFGVALGLIYYSSLFYSMDLSDAKGEHGGIHEAAIGLGNCAGPAVGAASLYLVPQYSNSGALAVTVLLVLGLGGMAAIWARGRAETEGNLTGDSRESREGTERPVR
jgi:hypothetical protein